MPLPSGVSQAQQAEASGALASLRCLRDQTPWRWLVGCPATAPEHADDLPTPSEMEHCRHGDPAGTTVTAHPAAKSVFYLAYGSNLSKETFLGKRGIRPISQLNVVVPSLRLTFDLPGIPYSEPCFANAGLRQQHDDDDDDDNHHDGHDIATLASTTSSPPLTEKSPLLFSSPAAQAPPKYHKDRWLKGLVGVVYELTPADLAHVIATEGGGAEYQDIIVPCHPLLATDATVPWHPSTAPIAAHTLFAPTAPPNVPPGQPGDGGGRYTRPRPSYAQPSARYLKLISDGAAEHALPHEYRLFLSAIRPYRATTQAARLGQFIFTSLWLPVITVFFSLGRMFADKSGRSPPWLMRLTAAMFVAVWASYDGFFEKTFGDGERTPGEDDDGDDDDASREEHSSCNLAAFKHEGTGG